MENKINLDGCGSLFKSQAGNILVCGEDRPDENCFFCRYCRNKFEVDAMCGKLEDYLKEILKGGNEDGRTKRRNSSE